MTGHRAASATTEFRGMSYRGLRAVATSPGTRNSGRFVPPLLTEECLTSPSLAQSAATCVLRPRPESVGAGREFTRAALGEWGMSALCDVAELVVSELVTNALRHGVPSAYKLAGDSCVRLRLLAQAPLLMCMVTDPSAEIPVQRDPGPAAECGRGLNVVESCCIRWGWHLLDEGGKVVWALLRPSL